MLSFVVRAGGGSVRDSLSVLDQLIAGSGAEGLTYESAAALLGFTDGELLDAAIDAFAAGDAAAVFRSIDKVVETGLDPRRFVEDLLERLRDLIVVAAVTDGAGSVLRHVPEDQLERMRRQAAAFGPGALSRAADVVNAGLTEMTGATAPRLQLELIAARILLPGAAGEAGYAARLDRLERRLDVGGVPTAAVLVRRARRLPLPSAPPAARRAPGRTRGGPGVRGRARSPAARARRRRARAAARATTPRPSTATASEAAAPARRRHPPRRAQPATAAVTARPSRAAPPAPAPVAHPKGPGGLDTDALRRSWPDVLEWLSRNKRVTWTFVAQNAQVVDYDGQRVLLGISTVGLAETFRRGAHADYVRQALIDVLGVDARVEGVPSDDVGAARAAGAPARPRAVRPGGARRAPGHRARPPPPRPSPTSAPAPSDGSGTGPARRRRLGVRRGRPVGRVRVAVPPAPASPRAGPTPRPRPTPRPSWASPLERAKAAVAVETEVVATERVVDDTAISDDDESIDDLTDVGVPVVERILGGTVIAEDSR